MTERDRGTGVFVRRHRVMRDEEPDIIEVNVLKPAVRMTVDCRCAGGVSDYVRDRDVPDLASGRFVVALGSIDLAATLDVEVNRVTAPPTRTNRSGAFRSKRWKSQRLPPRPRRTP